MANMVEYAYMHDLFWGFFNWQGLTVSFLLYEVALDY